jgi:outer membrane protein assembly factor BamA
MGNAKINNQFFLRMNAETSGNIPYLFDNLRNNPQTEDGYYERLNVRYSQFVRFDLDFRKFWKLRRGNFLAFRFMGGSALPYGNSEAVPFEKSFWLGGANDMRGWRLRSLGPGAYVATDNNYNKTGEIMLQSSIENRFPIYSFLLGSFFVDAGNVWLRKPSVDFPDGEFKFDSFYKQIAMDVGFGLRFDFSFFILRLDAAVPFHDPTHPGHWFSNELFNYQNAILNFGIGYPF